MSFIIAVYVNEGIVLASDRRITYTHTETEGEKTTVKVGVHTSNSTDKTFICPNGAGISTCGDATLLGKPITGFIQEMIRAKINEHTLVSDMPQLIIDYFNALSVVPKTNFIVVGYDANDGSSKQRVYRVRVADKNIEEIDTSTQGAAWDGETYTLIRLIKNIAIKHGDSYSELPYERILFEYFTLQDAVDFARFAVETTISTMRFKNVVETVGGNVDILVITPEETRWLQKEELH